MLSSRTHLTGSCTGCIAAARVRRLQHLTARVAATCASPPASSDADDLVAPVPLRSMDSTAHRPVTQQQQAQQGTDVGEPLQQHPAWPQSVADHAMDSEVKRGEPVHMQQQQQQQQQQPALSPAYQQAPDRPDLPGSTGDIDWNIMRYSHRQSQPSARRGSKGHPKHGKYMVRHENVSAATASDSTSSNTPASAAPPPPAAAAAACAPATTKISPWTTPATATNSSPSRADLPPLKTPPIAPEDPKQLLELLGTMPPSRKVVVYKGGGYIYAAAEQLLEEHGLQYAIRMTNLLRKAHCIVSVPVWDNGRRVNLKEHQSAAAKRGLPFYVLQRFEAVQLVEALRPLLIKRHILREKRFKANAAEDPQLATPDAASAVQGKGTATRSQGVVPKAGARRRLGKTRAKARDKQHGAAVAECKTCGDPVQPCYVGQP